MGQAPTVTSAEREPVVDEAAPCPRDWRRWVPGALVGATVVFNLIVLRASVLSVEFTDDTAFHASLARWVANRIEHGHFPLDGWYPFESLGAPEVHLYQSLPHLLTGLVGTVLGVDPTVRWILYLGLATWPIAIYCATRLFGFDRWVAAAAAVFSSAISSFPAFGLEWHSYVWIGWGVWSQLWGMWLVPFALAMSWRAVSRGRGYAVAALLLALTLAVHFLTGYVALLALGIWVVIGPREVLVRLGRAAIIGIGALLAAAWVIVPLLQDTEWIPSSNQIRSRELDDSFGASRILGWFVKGELFDWDRLPVMTLLVIVGLGVCAFRFTRTERYRAVSLFALLGTVLFFGRATWGRGVNILPFSSDVLFHRFIAPMHLGGIWLAGLGAAWVARQGWQAVRRARTDASSPQVRSLASSRLVVGALVALLLVAVLVPVFRERAQYAARNQDWMLDQRDDPNSGLDDALALAQHAARRGDGRVYAGNVESGRRYRVSSLPVRVLLENHDIDSLGTPHVNSLMLEAETRFDETIPAHYDLFNVRYLLLPVGATPLVPATKLEERGEHALWEVPTSGYLQVVDTVGPPIEADGSNLGRRSESFLQSDGLADGRYPTVAFAGRTAAAPSAKDDVTGEPGEVLRQRAAIDDGRFSGTVELDRPAIVLLKATYHPRWRATVDGKAVPVQMVAPALVGVPVGPGTHRVEFHYEPIPATTYALLFAVGVLALVALAVIPRWWTRRRVSP